MFHSKCIIQNVSFKCIMCCRCWKYHVASFRGFSRGNGAKILHSPRLITFYGQEKQTKRNQLFGMGWGVVLYSTGHFILMILEITGVDILKEETNLWPGWTALRMNLIGSGNVIGWTSVVISKLIVGCALYRLRILRKPTYLIKEKRKGKKKKHEIFLWTLSED